MTTRKSKIVNVARMALLATCVSQVPANSNAQESDTVQVLLSEQGKRDAANRLGQLMSDPSPLFSPIRSSLTSFTLNGTTTDNTVDARVGFAWGDVALVATASGPIDESIDGGVFSDLDGLRNSTTIGFALTKRVWNPKFNLHAMDSICTEAFPEKPGCTRAELMLNRPDLLDRWDRAVDIGRPLSFGVSFEVGRKAFTYVDSTTFAEESTSETPWAFKAGIAGLVNPSWPWLGAYYRREVSYAGGSSQQLCIPVGAGGALRCENVALDGPTEAKRSVVTIELRKYLGPKIAVNFKAHRDFTEDIWSVELPVFFLSEDGKGATGGVSLGWRSDTKELAVEFFVGPALGYQLF